VSKYGCVLDAILGGGGALNNTFNWRRRKRRQGKSRVFVDFHRAESWDYKSSGMSGKQRGNEGKLKAIYQREKDQKGVKEKPSEKSP